MTIKIKLMVYMIALTVIAAAAVLVANILLFSNYVNENLQESINMAVVTAENRIETLKQQTGTSAAYIASDPEIIAAIISGDQDALLERSAQLQAATGIGFCTIANSSGIALARPHKPQSSGDDISAIPSVAAALSGNRLTAAEPGVSVRLSICSGTPIYNSWGQLIGIVSVGFRLDTDEFVDEIKALTGCEITVFLGDERVSTTVIKEEGSRAVGTKAAENVSASVLAGNTYTGAAQILGRDALTKYVPIINAEGKVLGMLFAGKYLEEKTAMVRSFLISGLLVVLVLLALAAPLILLLTSHIVKPINAMVKTARDLALGDIEISVEDNTRGETHQLAQAFNIMIEDIRKQAHTIKAIADGDLSLDVEAHSDKDIMNNALKTMLKRNNLVFWQIAESAAQVANGARQIADSSQTLAQGASEQAAATEQLSSIINEVSENIKDNAAMAQKAAQTIETVANKTQKGSEQMEHMVQAVEEINGANQSINKIINVINEIAFQTDILALNAAVEAAHAGKFGKGFAVVAEEVRNLSAKSAAAAKDTSSLIANSIVKAEMGVRIAGQTADSLSEIVAGITASRQLMEEIAASSQQQSAAISQINQGINQVAQVVQQNSASAEESAAASEQMSGQAEILESSISQFKLKNSTY